MTSTLKKALDTKNQVDKALTSAKDGANASMKVINLFFGGSSKNLVSNLFKSSRRLMAFSIAQLENNPFMEQPEHLLRAETLRNTLVEMNSMSDERQLEYVQSEILGLN